MRNMIERLVYRITRMGAVVDAWEGWECLCGHSVCEWCDGWDNGVWSDEDMITRYDIPRNSLVSDV